ncbi:hypothetical protein [Thermococcus sp. AM4]|uniref:hypothetical protein n=1 Tax=Thermococcus sp. (strain AM4) TaxID=246969 RepID=UPI000AF8C78F
MKNILAEGIAIPEPPRLNGMKKALNETDGLCVSVDELETMGALSWLKRRGFLVESTSAVVLSALWKLIETGLVEKGHSLFCP